MARNVYIGANGTAKQLKTSYIGVNGVARMIKKAYIGDENGKAQLCWYQLSGDDIAPTEKVELKVSKIIANTYANETTYENEEFLILDVYPEPGGTVTITYEGVSKMIGDDGTSANPNAQQVFFGTFNGVADSPATPSSGTLTIEGDYSAFGLGAYSSSKYVSSYCQCITEIVSMGKIESIPANAFNSSTLDYFPIPISVTRIEYNAFSGCAALIDIHIPNTVTYIGSEAFASCTALTTIAIPDNVTYIANNTFYNCTSLRNISIPPTIEAIYNAAFAKCTALTNINIPASVNAIIGNPFYGIPDCSIISIDARNTNYKIEGNCLIEISTNTLISGFPNSNIPSTIKIIGMYAFYGYDSLSNISIPYGITSIENYAFAYCTSLIGIVIPDTVTNIGASAFASCNQLTSISMPNNITIINGSVFFDCTKLSNITIPSGVTSIETSAFQRCNALTSITLPANVTSIGSSAFYLSSGDDIPVRTVTMKSSTPAVLDGSSVFDTPGKNNIVVPVGSGATYKAAEYWSEYANYITEG